LLTTIGEFPVPEELEEGEIQEWLGVIATFVEESRRKWENPYFVIVYMK
jgi:hypothetical protein